MTNEEINIAIEEYGGWTWYAVEKAGWYYRQGGHGYTNRIEEAGKYSKEDAQKEIVRGEPMSIVKIPYSDYCNDLNEMSDAKSELEGDKRIEFIDQLCEVVKRDKNLSDGPYSTMTEAFYATAKQQAEAFLKTIGKWKE